MSCLAPIGGNSFIHRLDPRVRMLAALAFSLVMATRQELSAVAVGAMLSMGLVLCARIPLRTAATRLLPFNVFLLLVVALLPWTTPGRSLVTLGTFSFSLDGLLLALSIGLRGNAILLALVTLVGTIEIVTFGHALHRLRLPAKLVHLFLFTVRYIEVLHHKEYQRLVRAMKVRCFRPRMDRHTYRNFGYLVGMLLVKSFERAERITAAMRCRGFDGRLYMIDHFALSRRDGLFAAGTVLACTLVLWVGYA